MECPRPQGGVATLRCPCYCPCPCPCPQGAVTILGCPCPCPQGGVATLESLSPKGCPCHNVPVPGVSLSPGGCHDIGLSLSPGGCPCPCPLPSLPALRDYRDIAPSLSPPRAPPTPPPVSVATPAVSPPPWPRPYRDTAVSLSLPGVSPPPLSRQRRRHHRPVAIRGWPRGGFVASVATPGGFCRFCRDRRPLPPSTSASQLAGPAPER